MATAPRDACPANLAELLGLYTRDPQHVIVVRPGLLPEALTLLDAAGVEYLAVPFTDGRGVCVITSASAPPSVDGLLIHDGRCLYPGNAAAEMAHILTGRLRDEPDVCVVLSRGWAARAERVLDAINAGGV